MLKDLSGKMTPIPKDLTVPKSTSLEEYFIASSPPHQKYSPGIKAYPISESTSQSLYSSHTGSQSFESVRDTQLWILIRHWKIHAKWAVNTLHHLVRCGTFLTTHRMNPERGNWSGNRALAKTISEALDTGDRPQSRGDITSSTTIHSAHNWDANANPSGR